MKKYLLLVLLLTPSLFAHADSGPSAPPCTETHSFEDGYDEYLPATCGAVEKVISIDFSSFSDRFTLVQVKSYSYGGDSAPVVISGKVNYATTSPDETTVPTYKTSHKFYIFRTDAFEELGGVKELFKKRVTDDWVDYEYVGELGALYSFYVRATDPNGLDTDSKGNDEYVAFPRRSYDNFYGSTSHLECGYKGIACKEKIIYTPEKIEGNKIILSAQSFVFYPEYLKGTVDNGKIDWARPAKKPVSVKSVPVEDMSVTQIPSLSMQAVPVVQPENVPSFWQRIVAFFTSFFR